MNPFIRWGSRLFFISAFGFVVVDRLSTSLDIPVPDWVLIGLVAGSIMTLPFGVLRALRESDPAARGKWAMFVGLCVLMAIGILALWK